MKYKNTLILLALLIGSVALYKVTDYMYAPTKELAPESLQQDVNIAEDAITVTAKEEESIAGGKVGVNKQAELAGTKAVVNKTASAKQMVNTPNDTTYGVDRIGDPDADYTPKVLIEGKQIQAVVTGYSAIESCTYENCIMASGKPAYKGAVACPRSIPLGTKVEILGKEFTCEDRTHPRYDGRFDIFYGYTQLDHDRAWRAGIKTTTVTFL